MKLRAFLWILLREHVTFGNIERIIAGVEKAAQAEGIAFDDDNLENYIDSLAERLEE
jgi:hypothetical protein